MILSIHWEKKEKNGRTLLGYVYDYMQLDIGTRPRPKVVSAIEHPNYIDQY